MHLHRLHIHHLRNLHNIVLTPHPGLNFFIGENGSGKTSLLEGIHLLALGRSFRSASILPVVNYQASSVACFGEISRPALPKTMLGIEKNRLGETYCKVDGQPCARLSAFATYLPVQLITPDTFKLLTQGPEERRRFIDWGVFHVEPLFAQRCQRYLRGLKQRNSALKQPGQLPLQAWDKELSELGESISQARQQYLATLQPFLAATLKEFLPHFSFTIHYEPGWESTRSLQEALIQALPMDRRWRYTSVGPHRAELQLTIEGFAASQVLSRGQQKLTVFALQLAQAQHLSVTQEKKCIYLIDDMGAELDVVNYHRLLQRVSAEAHQAFLTSVGPLPASLQANWQQMGKMFHVEHGTIREAQGSDTTSVVFS